jgi:hypothetical protein
MNALSRIAQQLLGAQLYEFEVRRNGLPLMRRKRAQQMIAVQIGLKSQHDFYSPGLCALRCISLACFGFRERICVAFIETFRDQPRSTFIAVCLITLTAVLCASSYISESRARDGKTLTSKAMSGDVSDRTLRPEMNLIQF